MSREVGREPSDGIHTTIELLEASRLDAFMHICHSLGLNPMGEDRVMGYFFRAVPELIEEEKAFANFTSYFLSDRQDLSPNNTAHLFYRGFHAQQWGRADYRFFDVPKWKQRILEMLADEDSRERLKVDLRRNVQTNISDRYAPVHAIMKWMVYCGRFDDDSRIFDAGASQNHGYTRLALNVGNAALGTYYEKKRQDMIARGLAPPRAIQQEPAFGPVRVMRPLPGYAIGSDMVELDQINTDRMNRVLATPIPFKEAFAVDKESMFDEAVRFWALTNSFTESESRKRRAVERYIMYDEISHRLSNDPDSHNDFRPDIRFQPLDITDPVQVAQLREAEVDNKEPFKLLNFCMSLNQFTPRDRALAIENGLPLLDPDDGVIAFTDMLYTNPRYPKRPMIYSQWNVPYRCRTQLFDVRRGDALQTVFYWRTTRCREVQLGNAELCAEGSRREPIQVFLEAA